MLQDSAVKTEHLQGLQGLQQNENEQIYIGPVV